MKRITAAFTVAIVVMLFHPMAHASDLNVGDMAPDFSLEASDGRIYHLKDLLGKTVVIAWFPKAFTPG